MDAAIFHRFMEGGDLFVIHLLVCACYMVLTDLGKNSGKGPTLEKLFGRFAIAPVYDFLRHAEADLLTDSVDLPPDVNDWLLFDAIESFQDLFGGSSAFMLTFQAYYRTSSHKDASSSRDRPEVA